MKWFHSHRWVEVSRKYYPPTGGSGRFLSPEDVWAMQIGITVVTYKCKDEDCDKVNQETLKGNVPP